MPESDIVVEVELGAGDAAPVRVPARLVATRELTYDIRQVTWQVDQPLRYRAGQYMNVSWPGGPGPRSYSFSAAPGADGDTLVSAFIRRVPGGAFTERLFAEDLTQVAFEIEAPHGTFWLRDGTGPILLVGGGSGLAPLMSLLEDAANRGVRRNTEAVETAGNQLVSGRLVQYTPARTLPLAEVKDKVRQGLVAQRAAELAKKEGAEKLAAWKANPASAALGGAAGLQAYLCGPPGMIDAGLAVLAGAQVSLAEIHYDKFTDASNTVA